MKTLNQFSNVYRPMIIVLSTLLVSLIGCTKQDTDPLGSNNQLDEVNMKSLVIHEGTIPLKGFTRFAFTAKKEGLVITDGYTMNFLECTAELTFNDKQNFTLHTREILPVDPPMLYREITFKGKMTPSGALKFSWPETWWELGTVRGDILSQVREHTGMVISGQGINKNTLEYMGYFNGEKLFTDMHIIGLQVVPGTIPFFAEIVDGPVMINFMIDLEVYEQIP